MRFIRVKEALRALRVSALVFGMIGAIVGNAACKSAPANDDGTKSESGVKVKKDQQAFTAWETSGGASSEACFLWDETVDTEDWWYVADTQEEAEEMAVAEAESMNYGQCLQLKPRLCQMNVEHTTSRSSCVPHKGRWKCTVTVTSDCNFSVF